MIEWWVQGQVVEKKKRGPSRRWSSESLSAEPPVWKAKDTTCMIERSSNDARPLGVRQSFKPQAGIIFVVYTMQVIGALKQTPLQRKWKSCWMLGALVAATNSDGHQTREERQKLKTPQVGIKRNWIDNNPNHCCNVRYLRTELWTQLCDEHVIVGIEDRFAQLSSAWTWHTEHHNHQTSTHSPMMGEHANLWWTRDINYVHNESVKGWNFSLAIYWKSVWKYSLSSLPPRHNWCVHSGPLHPFAADPSMCLSCRTCMSCPPTRYPHKLRPLQETIPAAW